MSESSAAMMSFTAFSFLGLPAMAPFRSTTCRRRAPLPAHCAAALPGSFENTVADSMRPCSRRTQWPSFKSIAGMIIMARRGPLRIPSGEVAKKREAGGGGLGGEELRGDERLGVDRRGAIVGGARAGRGEEVGGGLR